MSDSDRPELREVSLIATHVGVCDGLPFWHCVVRIDQIAGLLQQEPCHLGVILKEIAYHIHSLSNAERDAWLRELAPSLEHRGIEMIDFLREAKKPKYHRHAEAGA